MIKATLTVLAIVALTACDVAMSTTSTPNPSGDVPTGGMLGSHPPNTARAV